MILSLFVSRRGRRRGDGVARHAVDAAPSRRDAVDAAARESRRDGVRRRRYEEDQEPDAPSIQVDLGMLRKTLTSHVDAKAKIEADIPAEAITAGACELNAFALRTELGDKHMQIINKVLETHSEHILEFSDFLDSRYKSMMRELCKQPEDIEGAANGV